MESKDRISSIGLQLLTVSALLECLTGLSLLLFPTTTIRLLFGAEADSVAQIIARICGIALIAISIGCWAAREGTESRAQLGTIRAITFYNLGAGLLFILSAASREFYGIIIWSAGLLHLVFAAGFAFSLLRVTRK